MIKDINRKNYSEKLNTKAKKEIDDLSSLLAENPNPVFSVSNKHRIIYTNTPGKIILQKLGLKGKIIPKKLIDFFKYVNKKDK